jgi:predicted branched-subunit amino acid permease
MTSRTRSSRATAFGAGARDMTPLAGALAPLGFVIGATAAGTAMHPLVALATAPLIFGASAQLVTIRMLDSGAPPVLIVATVALVGARLMLYGAVMAPHWQGASRRWKLVASAFLVEPTVALGAARAERTADEADHRRYYLGAAIALWFAWLAATAAGLLLGARASAIVPDDPLRVLAFVALAVPAARASASGRRAALAAAGAALLFAGLPFGTGMLVAATVGVAAGLWHDGGAT